MSDKQTAYRQIVKASSILGGAQVINIIIGFIRTKLVAVLLGAPGVGIMGLFNSPLNLISSITSLGINYSAVRDISEAYGANEGKRIARTLKVVRLWVLFSGIFGTIITLVLAPWLSQWTFGNSNYSLPFALLSITLLLNAVNGGQKALLQGIRRLKALAKVNVLGNVFGLLTSIPLYYYIGIEGVPLAIIVTAVINLLISWFYANKVVVPSAPYMAIRQVFLEGSTMVKLGIVLSISSIIGMGVRYLIHAYISREGSIEQVGLYQAGFGFINTYVGMVFGVMGSDYYPRLAAINTDNKKCTEVINQQIIISVTILAPLCALLLTFFPLIVKIVYTRDFLEIVPMGRWIVLSIFIKSIVWAIGYLYLAKGALRVAFIIDNIINVIFLGGYIGLYELIGLEGVGIADFTMYLIALPLTLFVSKKLYGFSFHKETILQIGKYGSLLLALFIFVSFLDGKMTYIVGLVITLIIIILAMRDLNKQLGLYKFIKDRLA